MGTTLFPLSLQFFSEYEKLLHSENYVTKRQSLKVRPAPFAVAPATPPFPNPIK